MKSQIVDYGECREASEALFENKYQQYGFGQRHIQAIILFICCIINFMVNTQFSVIIVAMTLKLNRTTAAIDTGNSTYENEISNVSIANEKNSSPINMLADNDSLGIYRSYSEWSKAKQDVILLSYFIGTGISIFPASIVIQKVGGKIVLQITYLITGLISFILPWLTLWGGWQVLCACRGFQGFLMACLYPASHYFIGKWIPINERGSFTGFIFAGVTVGTVMGYQISGVLAASSAKWPMTLWLTGALCIAIVILVTVYTADTPSQSRYISKREKDFILRGAEDNVKKQKLPLLCMLKSKGLWACIIAQAGTAVSYIFCITQVPTYMNHVLKVNVRNSGLFSSVPFVASFFVGIGAGYLSDFLIRKSIVSIRNTRRLCNTLGNLGMAACLIAVTFTDDVAVTVTLFVISLGSYGATHSGWMVNYIDLAPNFSGTLLSAGCVVADAVILILPSIVQKIITDTTNRYQWRIVFLIASAVSLVSNVIFVVFMSSDVQPWNNEGKRQNQEEGECRERMNKDIYKL